MKLKLLVLLAIWSYALPMLAQKNFEIPIGKPYPNPALVKVQALVADKTVSLSNWKGKPLIVDFFSSFCTVCFKSLPKIKNLQEQFKGDMRFLLIGKEDSMIRKIYGRFEKKLELKLDVAYDSVLHKDLREYSYPLYVWIDGNGIVRGVTGVKELTAENISLFIKKNIAPTQPEEVEFDFDATKPFLVNNNGGNESKFLFRSLISAWIPGMQFRMPSVIRFEQLGDSLQLLGLSMSELYKYAYFGELINGPKSPLYNDVFPFVIKGNGEIISDNRMPGNLYCYSLWVTKNPSDKINIQKRFKYDLDNQFGYEAGVEYRIMPYNSLTLREGFKKKLVTGNKASSFKISHAGFQFINYPVSKIVNILASKFQRDLTFIDDTGLQENIDIKVDALLIDFEKVKQSLYENGIEINTSLKPMRVIVLRKNN